MLLSWSAPVDIAESYQGFLDSVSRSSFEGEILFYNCTSSWFGPFCRFSFEEDADTVSMATIVAYHFFLKLRINENAVLTCYQHLSCQTAFRCLDWRNICDRKIDCADGSDEFNCWQLEINECAENEYRCHNGQCIPAKFFQDVPMNPDCFDKTDEPVISTFNFRCSNDPAFRCEEHTCRPGEEELQCGDGQCINEMTFRCLNGYDNLLPNDNCSMAMMCLMNTDNDLYRNWCKRFCVRKSCIKDYCPSLYQFPPVPVLFGHVRFLFTNKMITIESDKVYFPDYVCYDETLCANFLPATFFLNNLTCRHFHELGLKESDSYPKFIENVKDRFRRCLIVNNETHYCNHSSMYQCEKSTKCISKHRLVDGISDCPFNDDETFNQSCLLNDVRYRVKCSTDHNTCCAPVTTQNHESDCERNHEVGDISEQWIQHHIYFQSICDGKTDLFPILIDGRNETDETNCEYWPCNNTYTRCNRIWSCKDGADEINCPNSICPEFHHSCVFPNDTTTFSCLPMTQAGNGNIDCLGASDERNYCRTLYPQSFMHRFRCLNDTECINLFSFCNNETDCRFGDDEKFCHDSVIKFSPKGSCLSANALKKSARFICDLIDCVAQSKIYFTLQNMPTYFLQLTPSTVSLSLPNRTETQLISSYLMESTEYYGEWRCHRGLSIRIRMENNIYELFCLCPPSYYGDTCQYQNQRVSVTLQIQAISDWRIVFTFIVTLIDDDGNIESHDYIEYLPIRDCDIKFNIYLLYSSRPKNSSKTYSVKIDAFDKLTLNYRASWIFPLQFSFLPAHRLSVLLTIPASNVQSLKKCALLCVHGLCFNYVNNQSLIFCRCLPNWSDTHCNIRYECDCASNSLCVAKSVCLCPIGQYGPRCYLHQSSCQSEICRNGGQCVATDERYTFKKLKRFTCLCLEEYSGDFCEHKQIYNQIDILFHSSLTIPSSLLVHLITVNSSSDPIRTTIMKKISVDQTSATVYTAIKFNIAFVEIHNSYYLIILQEQIIELSTISTEIIPSHRCLSISELFDQTFANEHLLKRIKYYHIPCQKRLELVCFYDDIHLCLCNLDRQTNCFEFNHNMTYDCYGYNLCQNEGQCFLDNTKCVTSVSCTCRDCYYGSRCQFSTKGSTLSLDVILSYQIRPNIGINRQTIVIKIAIVLNTTMSILGFISSLLLFFTFRMKKTRTVGCGLYLLTSSIISMIIVIIFEVKFWLLLISQMGLIKNRLFIRIYCVSIDFLLRVFLSAGDWFSACVAMERTANVMQGVSFNKRESKQMAKLIIVIVFLVSGCTHIHDPLHRHLADDEEEQRTWCIAEYSPSVQTYDWIVNIFHFVLPFLINTISALIIIIFPIRVRSKVHAKKSFKQLFNKQFQEHKHLLIAPFILVTLAVPRLIVSFLSKCMRSARNPWLYLAGYFISFIPPILTFVVFVLPSDVYKKEFIRWIRHVWRDSPSI